jgi:hypothetical protein
MEAPTEIENKEQNEQEDGLLKLPDSRILGYKIHTEPENYKHTVVFVPGAGFGRESKPFNVAEVISNSVRWISVDKPG